MCFVPFVWGLGLVAAAVIVTFRRGGGVIGFVMSILGLASGAFFPLALLPAWAQTIAEANPVAIVMEGTREALIGGAGWDGVGLQWRSCSRCPPRRCSRAWRPSAPRSRASIGTGRWGCTDMWDRIDILLEKAPHEDALWLHRVELLEARRRRANGLDVGALASHEAAAACATSR